MCYFCVFYSSSQIAYRGVKNPEAVERKRKKQEEVNKETMSTSVSGGGGLKVCFVFILMLSHFRQIQILFYFSVNL